MEMEIKKLKFQTNYYSVSIGNSDYLMEIDCDDTKTIREVQITFGSNRVRIPARPLLALIGVIKKEGYKL
jgi:hypothetical protein